MSRGSAGISAGLDAGRKECTTEGAEPEGGVIFGQDGANPAPFKLATQAVAAGYTNVLWFRGGVSAWTAAGEPTVARSAGGGQ